MDVQIQEKGEHSIVKLEGELTIYFASQVLDAIYDLLNKTDKIAVDLSGIIEADTSGIQALIVIKREAFRRKKTIKYVNHSEIIVRLIDLLGLVGLFGDKIKIPAENRDNYAFHYGVKKQNFNFSG
ncbi:MAG: STAS domain-containing protein [Leptospirales bacterium]